MLYSNGTPMPVAHSDLLTNGRWTLPEQARGVIASPLRAGTPAPSHRAEEAIVATVGGLSLIALAPVLWQTLRRSR